jgi:hypothetical protein
MGRKPGGKSSAPRAPKQNKSATWQNRMTLLIRAAQYAKLAHEDKPRRCFWVNFLDRSDSAWLHQNIFLLCALSFHRFNVRKLLRIAYLCHCLKQSSS